MGMFAFKRLRELEAASKEVASFPLQSPQPQQVEKPKRQRRQPKAQIDDGAG